MKNRYFAGFSGIGVVHCRWLRPQRGAWRRCRLLISCAPVGALDFTKLPTVYPPTRPQREEVHRVHSTENNEEPNSATKPTWGFRRAEDPPGLARLVEDYVIRAAEENGEIGRVISTFCKKVMASASYGFPRSGGTSTGESPTDDAARGPGPHGCGSQVRARCRCAHDWFTSARQASR